LRILSVALSVAILTYTGKKGTEVAQRKRNASANGHLKKFAGIIQQHRDELLKEWRTRVRQLPAAQHLDIPTLNDHVPNLFDELTQELMSGGTESVFDLQLHDSAKIHGGLRLRAGFDILEVVAEYNILRELVSDVAERQNIDITGEPNRILNRVMDRAVALAVDSYAKEKALEIQQRREEHLSFVIHDLKTPLSAIHAAGLILETSLAQENPDPGRLGNMVDIVRRNAQRLNALITTASQEQYNLAASTAEEMKVAHSEFDLWPLVQAMVWDLRALVENVPVQLINSVPENCVVHADPVLITQVFQNLLSNAIKYTARGEIVVGAMPAEMNKVRCWVRDTGAGIPADRLAKIFEKFETDPKKKGGLGLGLPIVKQIVEAHGCQIFVESEVGRGATFSFTLPGRC
jgi:two-component system, OmpR family, phosphate regulon sensor histidine kinase PhoR